MEYYEECANHLIRMNYRSPDDLKKVQFVVFSDDPKWCEENFQKSGIEVFEGRCAISAGLTPAQDMYLMSQCDSQIISNSSFSWWAAFLNKNPNKLVFAPTKDKWYGSAYAHWNLDDLYRPEWILI